MTERFSLCFTTYCTRLSFCTRCVCPYVVCFSFFTAEVTYRVTVVIVCVRAIKRHRLKNLCVNVVVTCFTYACNRRILYVRAKEFHHITGCKTCLNCCLIYCFRIRDIYVCYTVKCHCIYKSICRRAIYYYFVKLTEIDARFTEAKLNAVKCVVVTEEYDLRGRIDRLNCKDRFSILSVEAYVAVEVGFCGEYERIYYRNLYCVSCVFAEMLAYLILADSLENCKVSCKSIHILKDNINNVYCFRNRLGYACFKKLCSDCCLDGFYVLEVFFSNESYPIHLGYRLTCDKIICKNTVNYTVCITNDRCCELRNCFRLEYVNRFRKVCECVTCVICYFTSEGYVDVICYVAKELVNSKLTDVCFLITYRDEVCSYNFCEINIVPAHLRKLFVAKTELIRKDVCVERIITDCYKVGILGNDVIALERVVYECLDCRVDLAYENCKLFFNNRTKLFYRSIDNVTEYICYTVCNIVANALEVVYASFKTLCYEYLERCLELFYDLCGLVCVNKRVAEILECILEKRKYLAYVRATLDDAYYVADSRVNLFNIRKECFYCCVHFLNCSFDLYKLCFELFNCRLDSCYLRFVRCLESCYLRLCLRLEVCDCFCKLCLESNYLRFKRLYCCFKLCFYSCDLGKNCFSCFACCVFKLRVKSCKLCCCFCLERRDLCFKSRDLCFYRCDSFIDLVNERLVASFNSVCKLLLERRKLCLEDIKLRYKLCLKSFA